MTNFDDRLKKFGKGGESLALLVIVGPTASGKSELAMEVAKNFDGEITAADSRTVYKGMDIGTAKPSKADQKAVKHWGVDLVKPGERFSAYNFRAYAEAKIGEIKAREKLPIIVGGTGLYIDSLLYGYGFRPVASQAERAKFEQMSVEELHHLITARGYQLPNNPLNRRHLIRTLESGGRAGTSQNLRPGTLLVGLWPTDEVLHERIKARAEKIFDKGIVGETKKLIEQYGEPAVKKTAGIAYQAAIKLIKKELDEQQAKEAVKTGEWQYARRQRTWFKRNPQISWFDAPDKAYAAIESVVN